MTMNTATATPGVAPPAPLGPVSAALEADLRNFVRRHGIAVWLDIDDHYSDFVDHLIAARDVGHMDYEVTAFRGSHLALMHELAELTGGVEPPRLVIHLPGFNEESIKATPLLELHRSGTRYRKALDTLVSEAARGRVPPDELNAFRARGALTLERADRWLRGLLEDRSGGLAAQLMVINPSALMDDLLAGGVVAASLGAAAAEEALWASLDAALALHAKWRATTLGSRARAGDAPARPEDIAFAIASWALSVEYVHDLRRAPVAELLAGIDKLAPEARQACCALAVHLRERHPGFYQRTADETETLLGDEEEIARAEDLGRIDTFRFEEKKVLEAAMDALGARNWDTAADYAAARTSGASLWIRLDLARQSAWQLVAAAASLGQAAARAGESLGASEHASALSRYREVGASVDRAHRELEQARVKLLSPQLPGFEILRARLDDMREVWREWADAWARDFNRLCAREGFLPPAALQQRTLFDDVVRPQTQDGTTALFVVDAFRFEMGEALYRAIEPTAATSAHLGARLAELPTCTEIGMNALAPVARSGRLSPVIRGERFAGFTTGEFRVSDPDTRRRAMFDRVGGNTCPWLSLAEVLARDAQRLKQTVAQARLVVVHSQELDEAGENGAGPAVFDTVMQQLRSAWRLLRDAGVKRFVFTADHGFLLLDGRATVAQAHGRKIDPSRRHVLSPLAVDHTGEARVALADLGYEGVTGHLMFPLTTAPFDTGKRLRSFVHGGNSLQERVIPVLTVVHRAASGGTALRYEVRAQALEDEAGMHRLEACVVIAGQSPLDFGSTGEIELALRVPDIPGVAVELCQTRGGARIDNGALIATVGHGFELFFRLSGRTDARALVVLHHPSRAATVEEGGPEQRFTVTAAGQAAGDVQPARAQAPSAPPASAVTSWLEKLPAGVRDVFAHIEAHGVCVEDEAATKLGGARALRRFSAQFEGYAALAPFGARIEVVGGVKRYVREGSGS